MSTDELSYWESGGSFWTLTYEFFSTRSSAKDSGAPEEWEAAKESLSKIQPDPLAKNAVVLHNRRKKIRKWFEIHLNVYRKQARHIDGKYLAFLQSDKDSVNREDDAKEASLALDDVLPRLLHADCPSHVFLGPFTQAAHDACDKNRHKTLLDSLDALFDSTIAGWRDWPKEMLPPYDRNLIRFTKESTARLGKVVTLLKNSRKPDFELSNSIVRGLFGVWKDLSSEVLSELEASSQSQIPVESMEDLLDKRLRYKDWFGENEIRWGQGHKQFLAKKSDITEKTERYLECARSLKDFQFLRKGDNAWKQTLDSLINELTEMVKHCREDCDRHHQHFSLELSNKYAKKLNALRPRDLPEELGEFQEIADAMDYLADRYDDDKMQAKDKVAEEVLRQLLMPLDELVERKKLRLAEDPEGPVTKLREGLIELATRDGYYVELNANYLSQYQPNECFRRKLIKYGGDPRDLAGKRITEVIRPGFLLAQKEIVLRPAKIRLE